MESEICRLFRELREAMDAFQSQAVDPAVIDILHKMHEAMRELFSEVETNRLNSIPERGGTMPDPALIELLNPEPTKDEQELARSFANWVEFTAPHIDKIASMVLQRLKEHRVASARAAIEWAAEKANISDASIGGAAGEYLYKSLRTYDAALAAGEEKKG